jgi:ubiquinone/menaquinone biosynthesis C-methylase UbiE/uncharacterized protein YbaR (Trm112 family)
VVTAKELKALYNKGENISQFLRQQQGTSTNDRSIIEASYDLQAGSYVRSMADPKKAQYKKDYTSRIADVISSLCQPFSIVEAGVGEGTTLSGVLGHFDDNVKSYGFDLCWSRVAYARKWMAQYSNSETTLFTGDLFNIPLQDKSIDVVYTSHSIEPNGGKEEALIKELYRITGRYLVLLEPGFELASQEAKERMESHGYCKNIAETAKNLGYQVIQHELFPVTANPLNPTALTIIKKADSFSFDEVSPLACPVYKTPLVAYPDIMYSQEALTAYPIIQSIPCLRAENSVTASHFEELYENS